MTLPLSAIQGIIYAEEVFADDASNHIKESDETAS
jgi:hypothetical protein